MYLAEQFSEYVSSLSYKDVPANVVHETKKRIVDSLGCAIGAHDAEPVKISRKVAEAVTAKHGSTLFGTRKKTSSILAGFVNGIMVRYFDYNDTYLSKEPAHPSDNIGPCFSVAEAEDSSGKDLIMSIALAYEIQCRLCDAADIRHRGWDHVCYGLPSTALASSWLMGLNPKKMTESVNLALNSHITMRQVRAGELSMWKGCSFANAARNGIFSAILAREGMTGPSPIFEGEMGFFKQVSGPFMLDFDQFGGRNGSFKIAETYLKYFPAEIHSQTSIWAALEIRRQVKDPEKIVSLEIASHEAGYTILGRDPEKWNPLTKETADHSLPYIVGMALLEGKIDNSTYSEKKFRNPKVLDFLRKITVVEDKSLSALYPEAVANRVSVTLSSGEKISKQVDYHKGHPKNPMTDAEVEEKFRRLTKKHLTKNRQDRVLETLWKLDQARDLSNVASLFVVN
ncbi:MAG TPA: MmgE/PrpD family protein [Candidatus Bathyarchaeia archaeon]|nr:MmgE/PrpD family protein [Candidatus Bathyarchaeia archaeon]